MFCLLQRAASFFGWQRRHFFHIFANQLDLSDGMCCYFFLQMIRSIWIGQLHATREKDQKVGNTAPFFVQNCGYFWRLLQYHCGGLSFVTKFAHLLCKGRPIMSGKWFWVDRIGLAQHLKPVHASAQVRRRHRDLSATFGETLQIQTTPDSSWER